MAVNMFDKPVQGRFINTYAKLPFQEIAAMGDQLQKASDEAMDMRDKLDEMTYIDTMKADDPEYQRQVKGFHDKIAELDQLHLDDPMAARYKARQIGRDINKWRKFGAGKHMADNYAAYQANVAAIEADKYATREKKEWAKQKALEQFQGTMGQGAGQFNRYQSFSPIGLKETLVDQGDRLANKWAADKGYTIGTSKDGTYLINENEEIASADEIYKDIFASLANDRNNVAWAHETAEMEMGPGEYFNVPGQGTISRDEYKSMLVKQKFDTAARHAAGKYGYVKKSATTQLTAYGKALGKAKKADEHLESLFWSGKGHSELNKDSYDDIKEASTSFGEQISEKSKTLKEYKKKITNDILSKGGTQADVDKALKNDPAYKESQLELDVMINKKAGYDSYLDPARSYANQEMIDDEELQWTSGGMLGMAEKDYLKDFLNIPKGDMFVGEEAAKYYQPGGEKLLKQDLNKLILNEDLSFEDAMSKLGFSGAMQAIADSQGISISAAQSADKADNIQTAYNRLVNKRNEKIEEFIADNPAEVNQFEIIGGLDKGKFASISSAMVEEMQKDLAMNGGMGYSVADGRQLGEYLEDVIEEFDNAWTFNYENIDQETINLSATTGMTPEGNPIMSLSFNYSPSIGDDKLVTVPVVIPDKDGQLQMGQELMLSKMKGRRNMGKTIIENHTPVGNQTIGQIAKGARLNSLVRNSKPIEGAKKPLQGFKVKGEQAYVKAVEQAGNIYWQVFAKDGEKEKNLSGLLGGEGALRHFLYEKTYDKWLKKSEGEDGAKYKNLLRDYNTGYRGK